MNCYFKQYDHNYASFNIILNHPALEGIYDKLEQSFPDRFFLQ
jgi:hypothetical protein